jgi:hypothetical protein
MRRSQSAALSLCNSSIFKHSTHPHSSRTFWFVASLMACLFVIASPLSAQQAPVLVTQLVDNSVRTVLPGNVHPLARAQYDQGEAPSDLVLHRMLLVLKRSPQQETTLRRLIENQQYKKSPSYHQWLTPVEFGTQFGPADSDIAAVTNWLQASGFEVSQVSNGRTVIEFSGTAGQVKQAFGTAIHKYVVNGEQHWANVSNPSIPTALAPVIAGVNSLNGFPRKGQNIRVGTYSEKTKQLTSPQKSFTFNGGCGTPTAGNCYALGPYDFASIYSLLPLWNAAPPINGTGQTIAIVSATDVNPDDATTFWGLFGLGAPGYAPMPTLNRMYNGPNPGITDPDSETEAATDIQWSGAAAPGATIDLVISETTETDYGFDLSAVYIVDNNLAPIMSESLEECEAVMGLGGVYFYGSLWEQAAAQGISVMVAAGDNGSAGCDDFSIDSPAQGGLAVNGIASTPYNVAVGGTDFNQYNNWSTYWNSTNDTTTQQSVKKDTYIPETSWNDSCTNALWVTLGWGANAEAVCNNSTLPPFALSPTGGSGGASTGWSGFKPAWQTGTGVPNDNTRDLPDVSLFASNGFVGSFYVICQSDQTGGLCNLDNLVGLGGTSVASPAFAGIMALVNQQMAITEGNPNYAVGNPNFVLYHMPTIAGGNALHDVPAGSTNAMPCVTGSPNCVTHSAGDDVGALSGYNTTAGYDLVTGLGSVNAANLVANWNKVTFTPTATTLTLSVPANTTHGTAVTVGVSVSPSAATGDVALLVGPGPSGPPLNQAIDWMSLGTPYPAGTASWPTTLLPGGTYEVVAHYEGDTTYGGSYSSPSAKVTVNPEASSVFMGTPPGVLIGVGTYGNSVVYGTGAFDMYLLRADVYNSQGKPCNLAPFNNGPSLEPPGPPYSACPSGTIAFTDSNSVPYSATLKLNSYGYTEDQSIQLGGGSHTLVANYSGDNSYKASTTTASVTVTPAPTTIANVAISQTPVNAGTPFTVTATVTTPATQYTPATSYGLAPTGTVSFYYGTTLLPGSVTLTGTNGSYSAVTGPGVPASLAASLTTSIPTAGTYNITATYTAAYPPGDANYASQSSSNSVPITVNSSTTPGYSLSAGTANPISVNPGSSSTATVTVTPANGYTGSVTLSCTISPVITGATAPTCNLNPNPVSVTSSGGSSTLTFATVGASSDFQRAVSGTGKNMASARSNANPTAKPSRVKLQFLALWLPISGLALVGFVFGPSAAQRRRMRVLGLICLMSTALILLPSCGGGSSSSLSCSAVPGVPTGLAASGTTSSGTTLTWTALATMPVNCSLTGYTVYQGGIAIATTTSATYNVTGLTAGTQYSFTVAANDSFGVSAQSSPVSVTTTGSAGTPSGTYTISITGTDVHGVTQSGAPATVTVTVN